MEMRGFQQYKEQSINTMTQGELLLLLYDELVKRLTQAELALSKENWPVFEASVQRGIDIIDYLDQTLDKQYPISANLTQLYEYFTYELGRVKIGRRSDPLNHVKSMVNELRDAFREAQKNGESGK
ncbi:flagellar export chaperone FliS [Oscillibacter sp.]|jgi:flagellar protein FliS|uniref:flagellar export chaperone FliS n=1 Tax=Oscillibacter sp. TaxID=1945593 RepID=UPI00216DE364|nr:flagellar export chaperone FliS [Oscillibacter sp.]MCI9647884.1 flagellar export chaperone FliS [Oscillibacter sp.]